MEHYYQKIVACPYGFHLVFVARQEDHLAECACRKAYMAELTPGEIAAQKKVCQYDKKHVVNAIELELHETKCREEHNRKMVKKQRERVITAVVRKYFNFGPELAREAFDELVPKKKPGSERPDKNDKPEPEPDGSPLMIFDFEL